MPAVEVLPLPESPDSKHAKIKKQKTKAERLLVAKEKKCLVVMLLKNLRIGFRSSEWDALRLDLA